MDGSDGGFLRHMESGKNKVLRAMVKVVLTGVLFFRTQSLFGFSLVSISKNKEGIELLNTENGAYLAYGKFVRALEMDSFDSRLHVNLGFAYELNEEYPRALKSYLSGERYANGDQDLLFFSCFNAARMEAKLEKVEAALIQYQKCLAHRPNSKEVKTNIELLFLGQKGKGKGDGEGKPSDGEGESKGPIINSRPQKRTFDSSKLSEQDIERILKEIKDQELKIMAKEISNKQKKKQKHYQGKNW